MVFLKIEVNETSDKSYVESLSLLIDQDGKFESEITESQFSSNVLEMLSNVKDISKIQTVTAGTTQVIDLDTTEEHFEYLDSVSHIEEELVMKKSESFDPKSLERIQDAMVGIQQTQHFKINDIESISNSLNDENNQKQQFSSGISIDSLLCAQVDKGGSYPCQKCTANPKADCQACLNSRSIPLSEQGLILRDYINYMVAQFEKQAEDKLAILKQQHLLQIQHAQQSRNSSDNTRRKTSINIDQNQNLDSTESRFEDFRDDDEDSYSNLEDTVLRKARFRNQSRMNKSKRKGGNQQNHQNQQQQKLISIKKSLFGENIKSRNEIRNNRSSYEKQQEKKNGYIRDKKEGSRYKGQNPYLQDTAYPPRPTQQTNVRGDSAQVEGDKQDIQLKTLNKHLENLQVYTHPLQGGNDESSTGSENESDTTHLNNMSGFHMRNTGKICDSCGQNPIIGIVFSCVECEDYELCDNCFKHDLYMHDDDHELLADMQVMQRSDIPPEMYRHNNSGKVMSQSYNVKSCQKMKMTYVVKSTLVSKIKQGAINTQIRITNTSTQTYPQNTKVVCISPPKLSNMSFLVGDISKNESYSFNFSFNWDHLREKEVINSAEIQFKIVANEKEMISWDNFAVGFITKDNMHWKCSSAIISKEKEGQKTKTRRVEGMFSNLCSGNLLDFLKIGGR